MWWALAPSCCQKLVVVFLRHAASFGFDALGVDAAGARERERLSNKAGRALLEREGETETERRERRWMKRVRSRQTCPEPKVRAIGSNHAGTLLTERLQDV
jgi:hypothetical protein